MGTTERILSLAGFDATSFFVLFKSSESVEARYVSGQVGCGEQVDFHDFRTFLFCSGDRVSFRATPDR